MSRFRKLNIYNLPAAVSQVEAYLDTRGVSCPGVDEFARYVVYEIIARGEITQSSVNSAVVEVADTTPFGVMDEMLLRLEIEPRDRNMDEFVFLMSAAVFNALKGE